ncbi:MAG: VIT domain-containing protein [Leptospira sp.]|nr:VIT domain-containing protein [Leptospira sp.]
MNRAKQMAKIHYLWMIGFTFLIFSSNKIKTIDENLASPLSLTASDGSGLILKSYESNTVLDGFFVFTEIRLSFYNPEDRVREGRFRITLPDNANLARFAMMIGDKWQEGEVVEREKATRVYEDFLHRKQDPALLESDAGNEFSARIFPIPAKSEKKLIISYSNALSTAGTGVSLPLLGLPEIENFKLKVMYDADEYQSKTDSQNSDNDGKLITRKIFSLDKKNYKPNKNFFFEHKLGQNLISSDGKNFGIKVIPFSKSEEENAPLDKLVILFDTSASSTLTYKKSIRTLEDLLGKLNLDDSYIFGFDVALVSYGAGEKGIQKLKETAPLGSSNLSAALLELSKLMDDKSFRLLIVSDSVLTAGETSPKGIQNILKSQTWIKRLDVMIPSAYKDKTILDILLTTGKERGISFSSDISTSEMEKHLRQKVFSEPKVELTNTNWHLSLSEGVLQAGDPITIFGEVKDSKSISDINLSINGKKISNLMPVTTDALLLNREVTAARIKNLLDIAEKETNKDIANGMKLQAIQLSSAHRIQCPLTSFLVLETADDYDRFQITRNALTDIMTIGLSGIEILNRKELVGYDFLAPENREKRDAVRADNNRRRQESEKQKESESIRESKKTESVNNAPNGMKDSFADDRLNLAVPSAEVNTDTEGIKNEEVVPQRITTDTVVPPTRNQFALDSRPVNANNVNETEKREKIDPYQGNLKKFYSYLHAGENLKALKFAKDWREESPEDILALLALGDSYFALGDRKNAVRSYTSFVDYFPRRADIRRWAGEKLLSIAMYNEAIDTFEKALIERPDHPSTYHLLFISYLKSQNWLKAYDTIILGLNRSFPSRFSNVHDIFYDDLDLLYSISNIDKDKKLPSPEKLKNIKIKKLGNEIRFILVWETDANDVDFHIYDKDKQHAFYSSKELASGGALYADLTGGYGPECFRILNPKAFPYKLEAHYYSRGPMGYGMGAMQVIRFDGNKNVDVETRSFVIMNDGAYIDLGTVK